MIRGLVGLLVLLTTPAMAQRDPGGTWVLTAETRPLSTLVLTRQGAGWAAVLARPKLDIESDGTATVVAPARAEPLVFVDAREGGYRFRRRDASAGAATITLHPIGGDAAELWIEGEPMTLYRHVASPVTLATGWTRRYLLDTPYPTNPAMTALFEADQAARQGTIDWRVVAREDAERRTKTQGLLDAYALHSGTDYYHAAFLFQHGATPGDYLKAHALAVIAATRGRRDAAWIAAATLDRYLQSIGRPQIYGTQYLIPPDAPATQDPYDRTTLSDALRRLTGVPTIAEQQVRRADHDRNRVVTP